MDLFGYRRLWFDIGTANESLAPIVLSAGDHDGRIVAVRLWDGAASVSGSGLVARLLFNDGAGGSGGYATMSAVSGEATAAWEVAVPTEALTPGHSTMSVEISQGQTIVCSRLIDAYVEPAVIDGDAPEAQDALAEFRAAVARLEDFTVPVPVGNGGTGRTTNTSNAVLTGNGTSAVKNVTTKSGALFATATNGAAQFGTLPVAQGGTGATTVAAARAGLGLGNTSGALPIANGGTGQTTIAAARNALGLGNTDGALPIANGGTGQTTVAKARNALGLGNTSGALPVANGGTGSTDAAAARTALGITPANIGAVPNSVETLRDTELISDTQNNFVVTELIVRKFGPCVFFRAVIKSSSAIPVGTSNVTVGTLAAAYRPGFETVLDLRAYAGTTNLQGSTAVLTGGGVLQLRVGTQIPANSTLAITGNWILAS